MNLSLRPPKGHWFHNAILVGGLGALLLWIGLRNSGKVYTGFGLGMLLSAIGLWIQASWARGLTIAVLLVYAGLTALGMTRVGFSWGGALIVVCMVWFVVTMLREKNIPEETEEPSKPLTSFVLLLNGPRRLTAAELSPIVSRAWGGEYPAGDGKDSGKQDSPTWVVGESPLFIVKSLDALYMLHNFPTPYSEEAEKFAQAIPDLRLRKAVADHRAWLSVDLMKPFDEARSPESYYPAIARLIAELSSDDCLAVYHPESNRANAWDDSLKEKLRGREPLKDFARSVNPPVLQVQDDDPDLLAATAEARRRFPEFVDAFRRKDGDHFTVKAPVTAGGRTEHIWIDVDRIDDDEVGGRLGNEPVNLGGMKLGDPIEVPASEVEDWAIIRGGEPIGLFSAKTVGKSLTRKAPPSGAP